MFLTKIKRRINLIIGAYYSIKDCKTILNKLDEVNREEKN